MKIVANEDILIEINSKIILRTTRMHSSRMRTARSSSRLLGEGGVCWDTAPQPGPGHPLSGVGLDPPGVGHLDTPPGQTSPNTPPPGVGLESPHCEQNS